ncbi:MAG: methyltransferase domain-containing protein [Pirellulaceae bacterium]
MLASLNSIARHRSAELMDQPDLPKAEHQHALRGLARLNRVTGIAKSMFGFISQLATAHATRPLRVLDVASGSGDLPIDWARRAAKQNLPIEITTLDISDVAVAQQRLAAEQAGVKITAMQADCLNESLPKGHDVVTSSLFMHHLDPPEVVKLVAAMHVAANQAVLICDLQRSRLNLALVSIGAHLLTRSQVVHTDAALSVHGAYTIPEFGELVRQAIGTQVTGTQVNLKRIVPCRFLSTWNVNKR